MTLIIPPEDTIVTLRQLHPRPSYLVLPSIFYYQPKHIFVLDNILFPQILTIAPHLSLSGFFGMVCEHFVGCLTREDPSSGF
jgi:hypothetical protein